MYGSEIALKLSKSSSLFIIRKVLKCYKSICFVVFVILYKCDFLPTRDLLIIQVI